MMNVTPFAMGDLDWISIKAILDFPEAARVILDDRIAYYHYFKAQARTQDPQAAQKRLRTIAARARELISNLNEEFDEELTVALFPQGGGVLLPVNLARFETHLTSLRQLADWIEAAETRIQPKKKGPDASHLRWLVQQLDFVLNHFVGTQLTRSENRPSQSGLNDLSPSLVTRLLKIAGEKAIGKGTIDEAIKWVISQRNNSGEVSA